MKHYFMVLRADGIVDCVVCHPLDIRILTGMLNGLIVGEGHTREEAIQEMRR